MVRIYLDVCTIMQEHICGGTIVSRITHASEHAHIQASAVVFMS